MKETYKIGSALGMLKLIAFLAVSLLVPAVATAQSSTANETACYNLLQGKVAYDKTGNKNWTQTNWTRLCKGSLAPQKTVSCYTDHLNQNSDPEKAIRECSDSYLSPLSEADMGKMMKWIAVKTGALRTPYCWKDSEKRGVGTIPGRVADCPPGYTNNGATCGRNADSISAPSKVADCPEGYTNMGFTCYTGPDTYSAPSRLADCSSGYTNMGLDCQKGANIFDRSSNMSCPSGYFMGFAKRCYQNCRSGYTNNGEFCGRDASTLGADRMTCPTGYHQSDITKRCIQDCPAGYTNTGETCFRGVSTMGMDSMTCKPGEEKIGARCFNTKNQGCAPGYEWQNGFCYPACKSAFYGEGPICWQKCPSQLQKVDCAAGCATTTANCALSTTSMVIAPIMLAINIATLESASEGTTVANGATQVGSNTGKLAQLYNGIKATFAAAKGNAETLVGGAENLKTITGTLDTANKVRTVGGALYSQTDLFSREFADNFAAMTSPEIEQEIDSHFGPDGAYQVKRQWGYNHLTMMLQADGFATAKTVMTIVSVFDPTGITSVVNAYTHPICKKDSPFPNVKALYTN